MGSWTGGEGAGTRHSMSTQGRSPSGTSTSSSSSSGTSSRSWSSGLAPGTYTDSSGRTFTVQETAPEDRKYPVPTRLTESQGGGSIEYVKGSTSTSGNTQTTQYYGVSSSGKFIGGYTETTTTNNQYATYEERPYTPAPQEQLYTPKPKYALAEPITNVGLRNFMTTAQARSSTFATAAKAKPTFDVAFVDTANKQTVTATFFTDFGAQQQSAREQRFQDIKDKEYFNDLYGFSYANLREKKKAEFAESMETYDQQKQGQVFVDTVTQNFGLTLFKTGQFIESKGKNERGYNPNYVFGKLLQGTGQRWLTEPRPVQREAAITAVTSIAFGGAAGATVNFAGGTFGMGTARTIEYVGGGALIGLGLYDVKRSYDKGGIEGVGGNLPNYIIGAAGFTKGYGSVTAPKVTYGKATNPEFFLRQTGDGFVGVERFKIPVTVKEYGGTTKGFVMSETSIVGTPKGQRDFSFELFRTTRSTKVPYSRVLKGRTTVESFQGFGTTTPDGVITAVPIKNSLYVAKNEVTFTQPSIFGTRTKTLSTFGTFTEKGEGFTVTETGFGIGDTVNIPYKRGTFKGGVLTQRDAMLSIGEQRISTRPYQGIEPNVANQAFNVAERFNFYTPQAKAYAPSRTAKSPIPIGRKGQITIDRNMFGDTTGFGRIQPETVFSPASRAKSIPTSKAYPQIPAIPRSTPLYANSARSLFGSSSLFGAGTKSPTLSGASVRPTFIPRATATPTATPDIFTQPATTPNTIFTPKATTRTIFTPTDTPFNPTPTPRTPPREPPPFIPAFGIPPLGGGVIGKGRGEGYRKGRSYQYAPSITSALFKIKGKQQKTITGFEVRPIARL